MVCFRTNFRGTFNEYLDENSETVPETFAGCVAVFCNPSTYFSESKSLCINIFKKIKSKKKKRMSLDFINFCTGYN